MKLANVLASLFRIKLSLLVAVLFAFLILLWLSLYPADSAPKQSGDSTLVPAVFLKWPEKGSEHGIIVDKSQQKVFVYKKDDPARPVKVYTCSTGENDGKKARQNDRKTPEGIYFFVNVYEQKDLAPVYGSRAFPLDYPNPIDRREGRDGYGIWFHGTNKPLKAKDTNGCIAMENPNIEEISSYIRLHDTPVIISSKAEMADQEKIQKEREEMEKVVEGWRRAWEGKQIDKYMSYYSPHFTSGNKDWKGWKEYKARLARQYREIHVKLDNLGLYKNEGVVVASFIQKYNAAGFNSQGLKRLFLQQNSNQWKIVGEVFETPEERPVPPPVVTAAVKRPPPSASGEIRSFIESWRKAWERKDLRNYIACYDAGFSSRGMDLNRWRKHRETLNQQHESLTVELKDLKIRESPGDTATVTFIQDYQADSYRDVGLKNILLTKRGPNWKIKKEEWRPLGKKNSRR